MTDNITVNNVPTSAVGGGADFSSNGEQVPQVIKRWDDLDLKESLLRGIYAYGFENPSEIQKKAIPAILTGRDTIGQAQSGCGKTGTFAIGLLQRLDITSQTTQTLILVPTHELVHQIATVIRALGSFMDGLEVRTMVGGTSVREEIDSITKCVPHVVVGCTGRVLDMIHRRALNACDIKMLIMDEADEMLSHGFKDQVYEIFQQLNMEIQVALFSATMPPEILELAEKFMRDPIQITMKAVELNLECIKQYYVALASDDAKFDMLKTIFEKITISQCIIYVNTVPRVVDLYDALVRDGFPVCCIHSSMDKAERDRVMTDFRKGTYRMMISSNLTARGIDVQQVGTVINFDIPSDVHSYLHRIGRSGRWGRKGKAINFMVRQDVRQMRRIEEHYGSTVEELPQEF